MNKVFDPILDALPTEYSLRVKTMEVDERSTETYIDIDESNKQIEELTVAMVLLMHQADKLKTLDIELPKGVLMYEPSSTRKTFMVRVCAAQTKPCFLKLVDLA